MNPQDFDYISTVLRKRSGLVLTPDKTYLLESRLLPVARRNGAESVEALIAALRRAPREDLLVAVTEAMTTNESFFFRDKTPFDQFTETMLPALLDARKAKKHLKIWCAACSTGQEPYSIAILLREAAAQLAGWRIDILGTDLAGNVLEKAKAGIYSQFEVQRGLPIKLLVKYFDKREEHWQVKPDIRAMVDYKAFNLLDDPARLGSFDIIFLRNVLIYFDRPTKAKVLEAVSRITAPDGYLVLGAAETVLGITDAYRPVRGSRGLYEVVGAAEPKANLASWASTG